jgi:hypothetical protein
VLPAGHRGVTVGAVDVFVGVPGVPRVGVAPVGVRVAVGGVPVTGCVEVASNGVRVIVGVRLGPSVDVAVGVGRTPST